MTACSASCEAMTQCGLAARFLALRVFLPVLKSKLSSIQITQTIMRCGDPSGRGVAIQYCLALESWGCAHFQGSIPALPLAIPYPGMCGRPDFGSRALRGERAGMIFLQNCEDIV